MSEWKIYKLGDLGTLARGKSKHRPRDAAFLYGGNILLFKPEILKRQITK